MKKLENFVINNPDALQNEFYGNYDPDYWLYQISLLKNCHDNFDTIKNHLTAGLPNVNCDDFKRMLRTELHFLYFQMVETLFEIIFAISTFDDKYLWLALTFSDWKDNYQKIKEFSEGKLSHPDFEAKIEVEIQEQTLEIPLLRWIFYFACSLNITEAEWAKIIENIYKLLKVFAKDFSDRNEYNAYKHSLRFYNRSFALWVGIEDESPQNMQNVGRSDDAITYLEEHIKKDSRGNPCPTGKIQLTTKPFDFERDHRCCLVIYEMIKNIIDSRKFFLLEKLRGEEFQLFTFQDIEYPQIILSKASPIKFSHTV